MIVRTEVTIGFGILQKIVLGWYGTVVVGVANAENLIIPIPGAGEVKFFNDPSVKRPPLLI